MQFDGGLDTWFKILCETESKDGHRNLTVLVRDKELGSAELLRHRLVGDATPSTRVDGLYGTKMARRIANELSDYSIPSVEWKKNMSHRLAMMVEKTCLLQPSSLDDSGLPLDVKKRCQSFLAKSNDIQNTINNAVQYGLKHPSMGVRYLDLVNLLAPNICGEKITIEEIVGKRERGESARFPTVTAALKHIQEVTPKNVGISKHWFKLFGDCYSGNFAKEFECDFERQFYSDISSSLFEISYKNLDMSKSRVEPPIFQSTMILPRPESIMHLSCKSLKTILDSTQRKEYLAAYKDFEESCGIPKRENAVLFGKQMIHYTNYISRFPEIERDIERLEANIFSGVLLNSYKNRASLTTPMLVESAIYGDPTLTAAFATLRVISNMMDDFYTIKINKSRHEVSYELRSDNSIFIEI